jgi:flagellar motor switch protein FliN/FliY
MKSDEGAAEAAVAAAVDGKSFETLLSDVPLELSVELGRITLSLRDVAARLGPGSIIPLSKLTGEKLDVRINERLVARAEAVAIGERYGIRIVEIVRSEGKLP